MESHYCLSQIEGNHKSKYSETKQCNAIRACTVACARLWVWGPCPLLVKRESYKGETSVKRQLALKWGFLLCIIQKDRGELKKDDLFHYVISCYSLCNAENSSHCLLVVSVFPSGKPPGEEFQHQIWDWVRGDLKSISTLRFYDLIISLYFFDMNFSPSNADKCLTTFSPGRQNKTKQNPDL